MTTLTHAEIVVDKLIGAWDWFRGSRPGAMVELITLLALTQSVRLFIQRTATFQLSLFVGTSNISMTRTGGKHQRPRALPPGRTISGILGHIRSMCRCRRSFITLKALGFPICSEPIRSATIASRERNWSWTLTRHGVMFGLSGNARHHRTIA
jgi:hypothetical protein